jgi:hypothetical protein
MAPQETKVKDFIPKIWWVRKVAWEMDLDSSIKFLTHEQTHTRKGVHGNQKKRWDLCFQIR